MSVPKSLLLLAAALILTSTNPARGQTLDGVVRGTLGESIPGVQILLQGTNIGTVTDNEGRFEFRNLAPAGYTVTFRFIGFRTAEHRVDLSKGDVTLNITLVEEIVEIAEVTVTAEGTRQSFLTRAPVSVSTLNPAELSDVRGQSIGETLAHLPGITTLSTGPTISKPVIRGLHSDRLVILNAGVRQEGQQWGGEHAPEIDPFSPDRIEVVRGASGVEYGVGAIGGVIRIEPRELPDRPGYGGQLLVNGFSNSGQASGSMHVEGSPQSVRGLGWRVQASGRAAGDAETPDYVLGNTAFRELNGSAALGYHNSRFGVESFASHFSTELGIFRGSHINTIEGLLTAIELGRPAVEYEFGYDIDVPKQDVSHSVVALKGHWKPGPPGSLLEVKYGTQRNSRREFDAHRIGGRPSDRPAFDLTLISHSIDAKYRPSPIGNAFAVFGVSGLTQGNKNGSLGYLIPNFRAVTGGIFARGFWSKGKVNLEAGTRFDYRWLRAFPRQFEGTGSFERDERRFNSLSGVAGAIWQFHPSWSLGLNLGTAWRPPNMSELYSFGLHHGTAQFEIGDRTLDAERSMSIDGTLRHASGRANLEIGMYLNQFDKFIYLFPESEPTVTIRGVFPTFSYRQTDARLSGIDGLFEYSIFRFLTTGVSGSIVRARDIDNDIDLINMPADRLHLHTAFKIPDRRSFSSTEIELGSKLVAKQTRFPVGVDYADPPDGYTLFEINLRSTVSFGSTHMDVSLSVNNVFNSSYRDYLSRYRYFVDEPGRTVILRLRLPLGTYNDN